MFLVEFLEYKVDDFCDQIPRIYYQEFPRWQHEMLVLGSKELGTNVLELHFVILTNHDQNTLILFRLAQSMCFCVKLESSYCRNLLCKFAWLDRSRIRLDQSKLMQIVFSAEFSNSAQTRLTCMVLCFALSIKGKTLTTF